MTPVLDDEKHYWVGDAEVKKLLKHGDNWLTAHPEQESIVLRYLKHQRKLTQEALAQLREEDAQETDEFGQAQEEQVEERIGLNEVRLAMVTEVLKQCGARRVLDLGCGEGKLLRKLLTEEQFEEIVGMDVSHRILKIAQERLHYDRLPDKQKKRLRLFQGSLGFEINVYLDTMQLRL